MTHRLLRLTMMIGVLSLLTTCGEARDEKTFVFALLDEHKSLDPQAISWLEDGRIAEQLFETLLTYNPVTLELEPGAAERWSVSDDGLTYTFHLRPNAKWSNGDPVTSHDFAYAWRRALMPDFAADYAKLLFRIRGAQAFFEWRNGHLTANPQEVEAQFNEMVAVHCPDDHTLTVTLERPTPYFLELAAFTTLAPVHRASVDAALRVNILTGMMSVDASYFSDPQRLVTNGPYQLTRRRFKQDLLLTANPHYHSPDAIKTPVIHERIFGDLSTAMLAYESGEIDWIPLPTLSPQTADLVQQRRSDLTVTPANGVYFYNFNCQPTLADGSTNPLADRRIREALSLAIDRDALTRHVTRLNQPVVTTFIPPGVLPDYPSPDAPITGQDLPRARALLAEAGHPDGSSLKGLSILFNTGHGHDLIAQAIKRMWEESLGVVVTLEGVEGRVFADRLDRRDFVISRASWFGDYRDPTTWLDKMRSTDGNNNCGYTNPDYDALLLAAALETDPRLRLNQLAQAEALMLRDHPMAILFQYLNANLQHPRVTNLHHNAWNKWRLEQIELVP